MQKEYYFCYENIARDPIIYFTPLKHTGNKGSGKI